MAMFMATVLNAAPCPRRSGGSVSATSDCATGIWHRRTTPISSVMPKMCQTSNSPVSINASIKIPRQPMMNSTEHSSRFRGSRSANAPANRARKFRAMRAAAMAPTRKGESVSVSTNQPNTADSICVPTPTRAVELHTKAKLRCRKIANGEAAWLNVLAILNVAGYPAA